MRDVRTVWQASTENGDKPGNGIKLVDSDGRLSATFFLLDPNKPHDFKAASKGVGSGYWKIGIFVN